MHVLGIDAGGTRTVCLLADERGAILSEAVGGPANLQAAGELEVEKVLHAVMQQSLQERQLPAAICLGMAGVDRAQDVDVVRGIMQRIGSKARVLIVNDALIALVAGIGDAPGVVIVAGTGSIAYGRNGGNESARAGGWGHVLGDEGSGYWVGRLALRAVLRQAEGRGRPTRLTSRLLQRYRLQEAQDLVHEVYYRSPQPSTIAALSAEVQGAADEGDEIALGILDSGARELAASGVSVATAPRSHGARLRRRSRWRDHAERSAARRRRRRATEGDGSERARQRPRSRARGRGCPPRAGARHRACRHPDLPRVGRRGGAASGGGGQLNFRSSRRRGSASSPMAWRTESCALRMRARALT